MCRNPGGPEEQNAALTRTEVFAGAFLGPIQAAGKVEKTESCGVSPRRRWL